MRKSIGLFLVVIFVLQLNAQQIGSGLTTRITDFSGVLKTGAYEGISPTGGVPDSTHTFQHLFVLRHLNQNNNHQFQLGSTYTENDRMFFRKIAGDTIPKNTPWYEIATRGANNFIGNQTIDGNLTLNKELSFKHQRIDFTAAPRTVINPMSLKLWDNYNNGGPSQYGTVMEIYGYSGHQTSQLYFGGADSSRIRYREAFYNQNSWSDWVTLLDSKNDIESQGNLKMTGNGNHYFLNGNVGIGTTSPQAGLHVSKFSIIDSANVAAVLGADYNQWTYFGGTTGGRIRGSNEGYLALGGNPKGTGDKNLYLNMDGPGNILMANGGGNVGIGTTSPGEKLEVVGKIRAHGDVRAANVLTFADDARFKISKTVIPSLIPDTFSMPQYGIAAPGTSGAADLWIAGYNGIKMFTDGNATPRFSIQKDGNIGIGTLSPRGKLDVVGNTFINGELTTDKILKANGTDSVGGQKVAAILGNHYQSYTCFGAQNGGRIRGSNEGYLILESNPAGYGTKGVFINSYISNANVYLGSATGNVAIGNTQATAKLDVAATTGGGIRIGKLGDAGSTNVALNAQTAQYNLDFTGYSSTYNNQIGARVAALRFNNNAANNASKQKTGLAFYTNPSGQNSGTTDLLERMRISPEGFVGIGTKAPDQMLTVKGKIHAEEVIIDLSVPAADYVFNSDYSLMPLHKVEAFVKTNKHLPEIPSAAEVKEKGLSMGEMQNKLLQKIEELTLYVIEQQKQIEELKAQIVK